MATPEPGMQPLAKIVGQLPSTSSPDTARNSSSRSEYVKAASQLFRSFRGTEAADPEVFITSIMAVMMHYPIDVAWAIADPYSGIAGQQNWVPTPFDVRKACDAIHIPRLQAAARARNVRAQLAERDRLDALPPPRQSYAEIKAEMATHGIFFGHGRPQQLETPDTVKAKLGITDEQWAALPDLPKEAQDWEKSPIPRAAE